MHITAHSKKSLLQVHEQQLDKFVNIHGGENKSNDKAIDLTKEIHEDTTFAVAKKEK